MWRVSAFPVEPRNAGSSAHLKAAMMTSREDIPDFLCGSEVRGQGSAVRVKPLPSSTAAFA